MSQVRLWGSFLLILGLIVAVLPLPVGAYGGYPLAVSDTEVEGALDYLRSAQADDGNIGGFGTSAWVVMAVAAAGENPRSWRTAWGNPSIVDYLRSNVGEANLSIASDVARMILAIVAAGENPRNFGGVDFVAALKSLYDSTQVGDSALVNDDFWAVLALIAAGENPNSKIIQNTLSFIKNCQQPSDGGWGYDVNASWGTDVDSTASAIMALIAAGESADSDAVTKGLSYIKSQQADNGGFLSWESTNPSTNSWAIGAIVAAGQNPTGTNWTNNSATPVDDLLSFQNATDGSFSNGYTSDPDPWTTSYALPALLGKPYPVRVNRVVVGVSGGGGGGGGTSYYRGKASLFGKEVDYSIGRDGALKNDLEAASEDGVVGIAIPRGTVARDGEGAPIRTLDFAVNQTPPLPPENSCLVGQAGDFSPRGATFSPPMSLNWSYAPQALPRYVAAESLAIGYFDAGNNSWVRLESDVDTAGNRVSARVSHFTTFALIGEVTPPPASFSLSALVIEPEQVKEGEAVSISVLLSNAGGSGGSYTVVLFINGAAEAEKEVTLAAGEAERVTFSLLKPPGSYNVSLGELQGSFIVLAGQSWLGRWWWVVVVGVVLVLVIFLAAIRRRQE